MSAIAAISGPVMWMDKKPALVPCRLGFSTRADEYVVFIEEDTHRQAKGVKISIFVPKQKVIVEREPSKRSRGKGLLQVAMIYRNGDDVIIELPGEPVMSERRISVRHDAITLQVAGHA